MNALPGVPAAVDTAAAPIRLTVNGEIRRLSSAPLSRLSSVLRDELGLTGTKVGCNAGDCGACTVLLDGRQVCACLVAVAQAEGAQVLTVEGLATQPRLAALPAAFQRHGAAQCGICTPGMLLAAADLLLREARPCRAQVEDALGGVLCRCTGYRKIVDAVLDAGGLPDDLTDVVTDPGAPPPSIGSRLAKRDGPGKLDGSDVFGADRAPAGCLWLKAIRSPYPRAAFRIGDLDPLYRRFPGLVRVLTAADVPVNRFGIYPDLKDQPVFAERETRFRGEAVLALVGDRATLKRIAEDDLPVRWRPLPALSGIEQALGESAPEAPDGAVAAGGSGDAEPATGPIPPVHAERPDNVLVRGRLVRGDVDAALARADAAVVAGEWRTAFVEHAYIEPEAGYALVRDDDQRRPPGGTDATDGAPGTPRLELVVTTQTPFMDRDEAAHVLGIAPQQVRIRSTCCGGGFGGKLDQSVQPLLAVAAWTLRQPVRCVYTRTESMAATTKRHPTRLRARAGADRDGRLLAYDFHGDFNTGAYASWGPTVAGRVPVHACGPYRVAHVRALTRGIYTNDTPAGAFRGFGVPQAAIAHETLMDELAGRLDIDPLEFRLRNALRAGDATATGQVLRHSAGLAECLERLRPRWRELRAEADSFNAAAGGRPAAPVHAGEPRLRRGVGIGCMWYGLGNTSMSNPSTMKVALGRDGRVRFYNGAQDIGQGSTTILAQILADALGVPVDRIDTIGNDTDRAFDAGKTSASRQTFVSGRATQLAGEALRAQILRLANAGERARIVPGDGRVEIVETDAAGRRRVHTLPLDRLPPPEPAGPDDSDLADCALIAVASFDPPTTPLDADGQGEPYATYGFAAQIAALTLDLDLGTVRLDRIVAAHDVGRAINPVQVEGQIHGGIAQGIGMALMEEFLPGRTENLHDYLIPTCGDVPDIETILVEDPEPLGPFGAKGIGEPALVPTAPAILNAIHHAAGIRIRTVPALPHRILAALATIS